MKIEDFYQLSKNIDEKEEDYNNLIHLYKTALKEVERKISIIQYDYPYLDDYNYIDHIKTRIKSKESIIKKLEKKGYELTYANLIDNISDIAGVRVICNLKSDIKVVKKYIEEFPEMKIVKEKDYITHPKESGYSGYHIVLEVPIQINGEESKVKVEVQIRTMAMDFWSSLEHEIKYKPKEKIDTSISKELVRVAKVVNRLDNKMVKLYHHNSQQEEKKTV